MIDVGAVLDEIAAVGGNHEVAVQVDAHASRTVERECDCVRRGAGRDDEVVLELLLVAVVDDIHAAVHPAVLDFSIAADAGDPAAPIGRRIFASEGH